VNEPSGTVTVQDLGGDTAVAAAASIGISFVDKVQQLVDRVEYRRVEHPGQLQEILSLRYEAYIKEGALDPHPSGKLEDQFDGGTNVRNIGLYLDTVSSVPCACISFTELNAFRRRWRAFRND
jgi:hypothetical protein